MFQVFMYAFNAIMPILFLVLLGFFVRKTGFADDSFFKKMNSLVFKLFLPLLLFENVYEIKQLSDINWKVLFYMVIMIFAMLLVGILCCTFLIKDPKQKGVIIQCGFRSNHAIIGFPLAEALGGASSMAFASISSAVVVPLFNALTVVVLSHYANTEKKPSIKDTVKQTLKNPLIIAVAAGLVILGIRSLIPVGDDGEPIFTLAKNCPFFFNAIVTSSKVASPVALFVLGARFDFSAVRSLLKPIALGVILRNIVSPALAIGIGLFISKQFGIINLTTVEMPVMISVFGSPAAVASAVMVSEIGGDDQLGAQLVVWTSVISLFTVFATVFVLRSFALI